MGGLFQVIWQIAILRRGPQALPASTTLLWLALGVHWLTGVILGLYGVPLVTSILSAFTGTLIMAATVHTLLLFHRRQTRYTQTLTALAACEVLLGLISIPLSTLLLAGAGIQEIAVLLWLLVLGWNIAVAAHIFRYALDVPMGMGFLFAIGYTLVSMSLGGLIGTPEA